MRQMGRASKCFLGFALVGILIGIPAQADDFTIGLKGFYASRSTDGLQDDEAFMDPGVYFSWSVTDRIWISAGYVGGSVDFLTTSASPTPGDIEEVDSDLIVGWSFNKIDVGVGYRYTEFTTNTLGLSTPTESAGPMVYLGGGDLFGLSKWGYYWGAAYMFEDLEDDDRAQEHFNGEAGFRWSSSKGVSVLFGYRHKEYSGDGSNGLTFAGPVINLAYTFSD